MARERKSEMSELGQAMFGGAAIGAGAGFVTGGIYGGIVAQQKIEKLPLNQVTLPGYDRPLFEDRYVGRDTHMSISGGIDSKYDYSTARTATYPLKDAFGAVRFEHVPEQIVQGHGTPLVGSTQRPIQEPAFISTNTHVDTYNGVSVNTNTHVDYRTIGYWQQPYVNFETGISRFGHIMGYGLAGMAFGAAGGALIAAALHQAGK